MKTTETTESVLREQRKEIETLWKFLKEQHRFRVEDEYDELEIDDSWSLLRHRVQKEIAGE